MRAKLRDGLPRLVITAPAYNCAGVIPLFIHSLQVQNYENWVCYIIDDASTDDTWEVLKLWTKNDPRFYLAQNRVNKGALWNRDKMIRNNSDILDNDIVIYSDADDWFNTRYAFELTVKEYIYRDILITTARNYSLRTGYHDDAVLFNDRQQLLDAKCHMFSLFSFTAKLWRNIPEHHFIDPRTGGYYMMDSDPCFTFPIMWQVGPEHHQHLFVDHFIDYNDIRLDGDDFKYGAEGHAAATKLILESFHKMVENGELPIY